MSNELNLNANDGMSFDKSHVEDRKKVLEKISEITGFNYVTNDNLKYGFYIGALSGRPVADYGANQVQNEITIKNLSNE